jgi:hypothetical protein
MSGSTSAQKVQAVIAAVRPQIEAIDNEFIGKVVSVAQAMDELRQAIAQVDAALDRREFEKASTVGYGPVSEMFVFLQRTLGGLQGLVADKESLVAEVAMRLGCAYEEALPHVEAVMLSVRPRTGKKTRTA